MNVPQPVKVAGEWLLLQSGPGAAAMNMAVDEALLEAMPRWNKPTLRFYGWTEPAASYGYSQRYAEVERLTLLRPLVRRPTGGGIVPHDQDWTYSLALPQSHAWYRLPAIESYQHAHAWICRAFELIGVNTELAQEQRPGAGQCFGGYERYDVLWRGRKVAGAAQKRTRAGLLFQGSVQPPPLGLQRAAWEQAMVSSNPFALKPTLLTLDEIVLSRIAELAAAKYSQAAYSRKR